MTGAIEILRREHDEIRRLLAAVETTLPADQPGAGSKAHPAPTRPHPNMRPTAEVLKVVAPIAGATDWIRDVLGGRKSR